MINYNNIKVFYFALAIFLSIESLSILMPFSSISESGFAYFIYYAISFLFLLSLALSSIIIRKKIYISNPSILYISKIVNTFLILGTLGVIMVIYDRIYIQQVDYSQGIGLAREMWREQAKEREGVSSLYNLLGNIMFPLLYWSFSFCIIYWEEINNRKKIIFSVFLILLFSAITGGREPVLVLIAIFLSSSSFRSIINKKTFNKRVVKFSIFAITAILIYSVYIGYIRFQVYNFTMLQYGESLASRLGGRLDDVNIINSIIPDTFYPVGIYITHVKWVFINTIEYSILYNLDGISSFRQIVSMLHQYIPSIFGSLNITAPTYAPNWIPLTGSIWYDYNIYGIFLIFLLPFSTSLFSFFCFKIKILNTSLSSIVVYVFLNSILIFGCFSFLFETVQFIYLIFSIPLLIIIKIVSKFKISREKNEINRIY